MSIKYNGNDVNEIIYANNDVKLVKYDDNGTLKNIWAKRFILSITTNTGVSSVVVKRTASLLAEVPVNVNLSNGDTIYYGDTLQITSTASQYYTINGTNPYTTTVTANTNISPTATRNTNTITFTKNNNIASATITYYNTSGNQVTTTYTNSATITAQQGMAYSWSVTASTGYTPSQSSGSGTLTSNITINPTASPNSYTITFAKGGSNYGSWGSSTKTAYYGDTISRSGNTVTCYQGNTSTARWTNTFTNGSATGYTYNVSYSSITSPISSTQTITATTSRTANTYTISYVGAYNHENYASSYTYSASSQTKSIGTVSRSGYTYTVSTDKGSISGSTLTIPAGTTGTITVTYTWAVVWTIVDPVITGSKITMPKGSSASWTIRNNNDCQVTCYYKYGSNAYQTTSIASGGTFNFVSGFVKNYPVSGYTGYAYFEANGQTSNVVQLTIT